MQLRACAQPWLRAAARWPPASSEPSPRSGQPYTTERRALVKHVEPAEAPIELCEENDELDEAPSPPPRRRNRIRRKLRRSTIGGVVGALGPWPTVPWTSLGILLPWTPLFDTLSLVLLFLRSARVDLMERRFREEASTYIKSTVETDEPPLRILCMDGGGVRGESPLNARCARSENRGPAARSV